MKHIFNAKEQLQDSISPHICSLENIELRKIFLQNLQSLFLFYSHILFCLG